MSVFHTFEKWTKGDMGCRYLFVLLFFLFLALNAVGSIYSSCFQYSESEGF